MRPIPITERLPEKTRVHYDEGNDISDSVLAYDEKWGWVVAVYGRVHYGKPVDAWAFDASMVSGPEWDVEPLEHVTHWMPELPSPENWEKQP